MSNKIFVEKFLPGIAVAVVLYLIFFVLLYFFGPN